MPTTNLTDGSVTKALIKLSLPIMLANLLQAAYQLVDLFWVGRLGEAEVAAVSLSFPIMFLLLSIGGGLPIAGSILVAQFKGKNYQEHINHIFGQTLLVVFITSVALSGLGFLFAKPIIGAMDVSPNVAKDAIVYLQMLFAGQIFVFLYLCYQSLMRGVGEVRTPLLIVLGTVILNAILDPIFIFGYGPLKPMGVAGVALATLITQGITAAFALFFIFRKTKEVELKVKHFRPDIKTIKKIFNLGMPTSLEQSTRALGFTLTMILVAKFGTEVIAAYGVGIRIMGLIVIPILGFSLATSALIGHNMGAGKKERAKETATHSMLMVFFSLILLGIIIYFLAESIARIFTPEEPLVIAMCAELIKFMTISFSFIGLQQVICGVLRGSGDTRTPMILSMVTYLVQFPLTIFLSFYTPLAEKGLWISFPVTNIIMAIITYITFKRSKWIERDVTKDILLKEEAIEETIVEEGI
ncbi:MATE family efflux transporter [Candidatus Woesearchaeota archaeon]|nr:MATE family efflux transporter [Candidatus Woesearchaeota archaeon]